MDLPNDISLNFDLPNNIIFSEDDVFRSLSALRKVQSIGTDGLSGEFLFQLRHIISYPLFLLFRRSFDESTFPSILKFSSITPILKSGNATDVANYRPISILSHLSKLFKKIVLNCIKLSVNNIVIDEQHGFHTGRSTTTCNLVLNNFIFEAFQKRSQVDVVYTDFYKAFDSVNHTVLLKVLRASGFGEPLLSWFNSFLLNRQQRVKVFRIKSNVFPPPSGVPQGGHLSPILFLYSSIVSKMPFPMPEYFALRTT